MSEDASAPGVDGSVDRDFLHQIGSRVRELRAERGLTMQQLADRASISRRLMTQIEHGQANPSLVTITRIARQLGTDFTSLLDNDSAAPVEVFGPDQRVLVWTGEQGSTAYLLVATSPRRTADMWLWTLVSGDSYQGQPDPQGSQELFFVLEGALILEAEGSRMSVPAGGVSRLRSDRPYTYSNDGPDASVFFRTVSLSPF